MVHQEGKLVVSLFSNKKSFLRHQKRQISISAVTFTPHLKTTNQVNLDFFHSPLFTVDTFWNAYQISILCCTDFLCVWSFPFSPMLQRTGTSILLSTLCLQNLLSSKVTFSFPIFTSLDHFQSFYTLLFLSNFFSFFKRKNKKPPYPSPHISPLPSCYSSLAQVSSVTAKFHIIPISLPSQISLLVLK